MQKQDQKIRKETDVKHIKKVKPAPETGVSAGSIVNSEPRPIRTGVPCIPIDGG